eukprot:gene7463-5259_t
MRGSFTSGRRNSKASVSGGGRKRSILNDPSSPLYTNPPNSPPSLSHRGYDTSTLFNYYAVRGHMELIRSPQAVERALDTKREPPKEEEAHRPYYNEAPLYRAPHAVLTAAANNNNSSGDRKKSASEPNPEGRNSFLAGGNSTHQHGSTGDMLNPFRPFSSAERDADGPFRSAAFSSSSAHSPQLSNDAFVSAFTRPARTGPAADQSSLMSERHFIVPPLPPLSEPLFPRLRPPAAEEKAVYVKVKKEEEAHANIRTRHMNAMLAPVEHFYSTLYRAPNDNTKELEQIIQAELIKADQADAKLHSAQHHHQQAAAAGGGGLSARDGGGSDWRGGMSGRRMNASPAGVSPHGSTGRGLPREGPGPDTPSSQIHAGARDGDDTLSLGGGGGWANRSGVTSPAQGGGAGAPQPPRYDGGGISPHKAEQAVPPPPGGMMGGQGVAAATRERIRNDLMDAFVGGYYVLHPEAKERVEAAAAEAERKRTASLAYSAEGGKKKKKSKKKKAVVAPPREGEPVPLLHVFQNALLSNCDSNGMMTRAQLEQTLRDVPFEVTNPEAIRIFFHYVREESEARNGEANNVGLEDGSTSNPNQQRNNDFENSVSTTISKRSFQGGGPPEPGTSAVNLTANRSARDILGATSSNAVRRSMASNTFVRQSNSLQRETSGAGAGLINNGRGTGGDVGASFMGTGANDPRMGGGHDPHSSPRPPSMVYVREILAAIDELLFNPTTKDVLRWTCFNVFAEEGQGYIHKTILGNMRRTKRESCEHAMADTTPSMVKALFDCFDAIAQTEEEEYLKSISKGKKRRKPPPLLPHQKSIIPLHIMRKCHMDYKLFCAFFDALPQLPAAFMHVWLPLLFTGRVAPHPDLLEGGGGRRCGSHGRNSMTTIQDHPGYDGGYASYSGGSLLTGRAAAAAAAAGGGGRSDENNSTRENSQQVAGSPDGAISPHASTAAPGASVMEKASNSASAESDRLSVGKGAGGRPSEAMGDLEDIEPGTFPLILLGPDTHTRKGLLERLIVRRIQAMKQGLQELRAPPDEDGSPNSPKAGGPNGSVGDGSSIHSASGAGMNASKFGKVVLLALTYVGVVPPLFAGGGYNDIHFTGSHSKYFIYACGIQQARMDVFCCFLFLFLFLSTFSAVQVAYSNYKKYLYIYIYIYNRPCHCNILYVLIFFSSFPLSLFLCIVFRSQDRVGAPVEADCWDLFNRVLFQVRGPKTVPFLTLTPCTRPHYYYYDRMSKPIATNGLQHSLLSDNGHGEEDEPHISPEGSGSSRRPRSPAPGVVGPSSSPPPLPLLAPVPLADGALSPALASSSRSSSTLGRGNTPPAAPDSPPHSRSGSHGGDGGGERKEKKGNGRLRRQRSSGLSSLEEVAVVVEDYHHGEERRRRELEAHRKEAEEAAARREDAKERRKRQKKGKSTGERSRTPGSQGSASSSSSPPSTGCSSPSSAVYDARTIGPIPIEALQSMIQAADTSKTEPLHHNKNQQQHKDHFAVSSDADPPTSDTVMPRPVPADAVDTVVEEPASIPGGRPALPQQARHTTSQQTAPPPLPSPNADSATASTHAPAAPRAVVTTTTIVTSASIGGVGTTGSNTSVGEGSQQPPSRGAGAEPSGEPLPVVLSTMPPASAEPRPPPPSPPVPMGSSTITSAPPAAEQMVEDAGRLSSSSPLSIGTLYASAKDASVPPSPSPSPAGVVAAATERVIQRLHNAAPSSCSSSRPAAVWEGDHVPLGETLAKVERRASSVSSASAGVDRTLPGSSIAAAFAAEGSVYSTSSSSRRSDPKRKQQQRSLRHGSRTLEEEHLAPVPSISSPPVLPPPPLLLSPPTSPPGHHGGHRGKTIPSHVEHEGKISSPPRYNSVRNNITLGNGGGGGGGSPSLRASSHHTAAPHSTNSPHLSPPQMDSAVGMTDCSLEEDGSSVRLSFTAATPQQESAAPAAAPPLHDEPPSVPSAAPSPTVAAAGRLGAPTAASPAAPLQGGGSPSQKSRGGGGEQCVGVTENNLRPPTVAPLSAISGISSGVMGPLASSPSGSSVARPPLPSGGGVAAAPSSPCGSPGATIPPPIPPFSTTTSQAGGVGGDPYSQEFTLASYREMHQRRFHTRSEELTYLRSHFVTSRKRLLYLHEYAKTLRQSLMEKAQEVEYWKGQMMKLKRLAMSEEAHFATTTSGEEGSKLRRLLLSSTYQLSKALDEEEATIMADTVHHGGEVTPLSQQQQQQVGSSSAKKSAPSARSSALWLYAASRPSTGATAATTTATSTGASSVTPIRGVGGSGGIGVAPWSRQHKSTGPGGKCAACENLIQELRKNLARRDNELSSLRLDHNDLNHSRFLMEKELRSVKQELRARTDERNKLNEKLSEKEKALDLVEEAGRAALEEKTQLLQQVAKLKERNEVLELIGVGPTARRARPQQHVVIEEDDYDDGEDDWYEYVVEDEGEDDVDGDIVREEVVYDRVTGDPIVVREIRPRGTSRSLITRRRCYRRRSPVPHTVRRTRILRSGSLSGGEDGGVGEVGDEVVASIRRGPARAPPGTATRRIIRRQRRVTSCHRQRTPHYGNENSSHPNSSTVHHVYNNTAGGGGSGTPSPLLVGRDEEATTVLLRSSGGCLASRVAEENLLAEVQHLQKQLQLYREKWLKAQDEVEELSRRLSRKQSEAQQQQSGAAALVVDAAQSPLSNEREQRYLREIEMQKEELHRLERRLERQADNASFREEQLRQEQMDQQRQHRSVVQQLQDQLQQLHREINRAEEDRQKAVNQLRSYVQDGNLKEVLQQQKDTLHQRMTELTHEVAEVRGNERELKLSVQREIAEKVQLVHEKNQLAYTLQQKERQERLLNDEIQVLQKRVGESEGRVYALQERLTILQKGAEGCTEGVHGQNPEALASEIKGYAALMSLNTKQQQRLSELEAKLLATTNELFAVQQQQQQNVREQSLRQHEAQLEQWIGGAPSGTAASMSPPQLEATPRLQALRGSLLSEIAQLRDELGKNRDRQRKLMEQWGALHREHREVRDDNYLLAAGTEKLLRKLSKWRAKRRKEEEEEQRRLEAMRTSQVSVVYQREEFNPADKGSSAAANESDGEAAAAPTAAEHITVHVERSASSQRRDEDEVEEEPAPGDTFGRSTSPKHVHISITRQKLQEARHQDRELLVQADDPPPPPSQTSLSHPYAPETFVSLSASSSVAGWGGTAESPGLTVPHPLSAHGQQRAVAPPLTSSAPAAMAAEAPSPGNAKSSGGSSSTRKTTGHKEVRFVDRLGSSCATAAAAAAAAASHSESGGRRTAAAGEPFKALAKALKKAQREIAEYELMVSMLDATGKLDALLREAAALPQNKKLVLPRWSA